MKKITIFALHLNVGGIERAISNIANIYEENGYEVQIYCMYDLGVAYPLHAKIKIEYLMKDTPNKKEFKEALANKNIIKIVKEGYKSLRILTRKKRLLKKKIQSIDDGIVMTTRHEDNLLLSKYGKKEVLKIGQLHHDVGLYPSYLNEYAKGYINLDKVVVAVEETKEDLEKLLKDTKVEVVCISNMIDYPKEEPHYEEKENLCLAVGRLHPVKGFDRLIQLFSKVNQNWKLEIVGSGEEHANLNQKIIDLELQDRVKLISAKTIEELDSYYKRASIYCMSSYSEGQGLVLLEAMSFGNALVAYDVKVGPASIMKANEVGFLIKNDDEVMYINKLNELIEDKELRSKMQRNARRVAKNYDRDTIGSLWLSLIR